MYAKGLGLGLTTEDLRSMPYPRLANLLTATADAAATASGGRDAVVEATQAHIDSILG